MTDNIHPLTINKIGRAVDRYGVLQAEIAALTEKSEALWEVIAAAGEGGHDGKLFHANVSYSDRTSTDAVFKAEIKRLIDVNTTRQWRAKHSSVKTVITVKVTARSAALIEAGKVGRG